MRFAAWIGNTTSKIGGAALILLLTLAGSAPSYAGAMNVTTGFDGINIFQCTLRRAIENHNAKGQPNGQCNPGDGNDTILVDVPIVDLGDPLPPISGNLQIVNNNSAPRQPCINLRQAAYLTVNPGATVKISGFGIQANGSHRSSLIDNNGGNLTLVSKAIGTPDVCTFSNQRLSSPERGGIIFNHNNGVVTISGGNYVSSSVSGAGGAIYSSGGTVTINDQLTNLPTNFTDDTAFWGGAIFVENGATLNIVSNNFTFSGNHVTNVGGAIYSNGSKVTIQRGASALKSVAIKSNRASNGGGAIYSEGGQLSIDGVEVNNNNSSGNGGAIVVSNIKPPNPASITRTYFHDNSSNRNGGAVYALNNSTLNISASTFTRDRASGHGGGVYVDTLSNLNILNSTFLGGSSHEGIVVSSGLGNVYFSTILAANLGTGSVPNLTISDSIVREVACTPSVIDGGYNLQFQSTDCPSSIQTMNPDLDPRFLQNNGGPTLTIALLVGSLAIDQIPTAQCVDQNKNPVTTDQRGFSRPAGPACDIGAFEYGAK